jgi:SAM-dependent methyltransferase
MALNLWKIMKLASLFVIHVKFIKERFIKYLLQVLLKIHLPPKVFDDDAVFMALQQEYPELPEYGYDSFSTWRRGYERAIELMKLDEVFQHPGARIIEACCGDGMVGYALTQYGHHVELVDLEDWRDVRAAEIPFSIKNIDVETPSERKDFDLVFSYNSFEHIQDPKIAFENLLKVVKPGGYLYLSFGPLYASPWGVHAYRAFHMPYPQFLFSQGFISQKLEEIGIYDLGKKMQTLQPLNRFRLKEFLEILNIPQVQICFLKYGVTQKYLTLPLRFWRAFTGRKLSLEDLTVHSIYILIKKEFQPS